MTKHKISYRIITIILIISVLFQLLISISFATDDISDIEPEVSTDVEKTYSVETAEGSSLPTKNGRSSNPLDKVVEFLNRGASQQVGAGDAFSHLGIHHRDNAKRGQ